MAILYITELFDVGKAHSGGPMQIAKMPALNEQTLAVGGASAQSSPLNINTRFVRLQADVICAVGFSRAAVAASTTAATAPGTLRLAANQAEYFEVGGAGAGARFISVIATG